MQEQFVFFKHNGTLKKVDIDEIVVIKVTDNNYLTFLLLEGSYVVRSPLYAVLNQLPPKQEGYLCPPFCNLLMFNGFGVGMGIEFSCQT